jgi:hypothetical protein
MYLPLQVNMRRESTRILRPRLTSVIFQLPVGFSPDQSILTGGTSIRPVLSGGEVLVAVASPDSISLGSSVVPPYSVPESSSASRLYRWTSTAILNGQMPRISAHRFQYDVALVAAADNNDKILVIWCSASEHSIPIPGSRSFFTRTPIGSRRPEGAHGHLLLLLNLNVCMVGDSRSKSICDG